MASSSATLRSVIEIGDTGRKSPHFASRGMSSTTERGSALTPEVYSLKWNAYQSHVTGGLARLLLDQEYTDVTLACDGQFIQAHKLILSLCSPYFKRMFHVNKAPPTGNIIIIMDNLQFHDLENVIKFMYNGEVNVRNVDLNGFLRTGEILQIEGLSSASTYTQNAGVVKQSKKNMIEPSTSSVKTQLKSGISAVQNRALGVADRNAMSSSINPQLTASGNVRSTSSQSSVSLANRNVTITPRNDTIPVIMLEDPLRLRMNPSHEPEIVEDIEIDPLRLNESGIEISEVGSRNTRQESFESSDSAALKDESYQTYEPEIVYDDQGSNQEEEEEYVEMTEDFFDNTNPTPHRSISRQKFHQRTRIGTLADYKNTTPYRTPEQRRKTSALWDYFMYDTTHDLVQCQLKRNGMPCPFNARHKPLSNMKYHIRTVHPREFEIILPRLLSR